VGCPTVWSPFVVWNFFAFFVLALHNLRPVEHRPAIRHVTIDGINQKEASAPIFFAKSIEF